MNMRDMNIESLREESSMLENNTDFQYEAVDNQSAITKNGLRAVFSVILGLVLTVVSVLTKESHFILSSILIVSSLILVISSVIYFSSKNSGLSSKEEELNESLHEELEDKVTAAIKTKYIIPGFDRVDEVLVWEENGIVEAQEAYAEYFHEGKSYNLEFVIENNEINIIEAVKIDSDFVNSIKK